MTYRATIRRGPESRTLNLGRCRDIAAACHAAQWKCPVGWEIVDVYPCR